MAVCAQWLSLIYCQVRALLGLLIAWAMCAAHRDDLAGTKCPAMFFSVF